MERCESARLKKCEADTEVTDSLKADDTRYLCMIDDCSFNHDAVCSKRLYSLSEECNQVRAVTSRRIQKSQQRNFCSADFIELTSVGSSRGNQKKYVSKNRKIFVKMQFNYQGRDWNDDLVEIIASALGGQFGFNCIDQKLGTMDRLDCSYSEYFPGKFIAYKRIDPMEELYDYNDGTDQMKFALALIAEKTGVDCSRYFYEMLILDYLVCNEDRHLYNFGVLKMEDCMQEAPLFDFGLGLFEHDIAYIGKSYREAEKSAFKKPFGSRLPLIQYLEREYGFTRPVSADLSNLTFPSELAMDWLQNAMRNLEIVI